ncbi:MAG: PhoH family protein [Deltaproteobacteria bacterium]|nr:PhoH family protein [Deltaproteobacteria bacterium]
MTPAAGVNVAEKSNRKGGKQIQLEFESNKFIGALYGEHNANVKLIERTLGIKADVKGNTMILRGEQADLELARQVLTQLYGLIEEGFPIYPSDVDYGLRIIKGNRDARLKDIFQDAVYISTKKRAITPKSLTQKKYIEAIRKHDIVFGIGPAGTGKTYLAMSMAVASLMKKEVSRIVLTRPAVEAGERLGFLPGDLAEKVNPYLRPLYDALNDLLDFEQTTQLITRGVIEVAPLAFMRGRTLNDAFIILDEAQNTTSEQMKMFLTRLGYSSKAVITGDITQIDLPNGKGSGLVEAKKILSNISGIEFIAFSQEDVVRNQLVRDIISAYEQMEKDKPEIH